MSGWAALTQSDLNELPNVAEMQVLPPRPTPLIKRTKLSNVREIRAELARVYRRAKAGEIDTGTATRFAYILDLMSRMIERAELEGRIEALEDRELE